MPHSAMWGIGPEYSLVDGNLGETMARGAVRMAYGRKVGNPITRYGSPFTSYRRYHGFGLKALRASELFQV